MDKAIDLMNKSGGSMRNMSKGLKNDMSARVSAAGVDISVADFAVASASQSIASNETAEVVSKGGLVPD